MEEQDPNSGRDGKEIFKDLQLPQNGLYQAYKPALRLISVCKKIKLQNDVYKLGESLIVKNQLLSTPAPI